MRDIRVVFTLQSWCGVCLVLLTILKRHDQPGLSFAVVMMADAQGMKAHLRLNTGVSHTLQSLLRVHPVNDTHEQAW
jgi:hypothetical protein